MKDGDTDASFHMTPDEFIRLRNFTTAIFSGWELTLEDWEEALDLFILLYKEKTWNKR